MDSKFLRAEELGIRLEIVQGLPIWEPYPVYKHQKAVDRIRSTITNVDVSSALEQKCSYVHAADVYISFPDGSLKRPDISIFYREPEEEEEAIKLVPEAVIEVISKGYEAKDLEIGPQFYLSQGIKDVVVFNPYTLVVLHVRHAEVARHVSPVVIELLCGCRCTVYLSYARRSRMKSAMARRVAVGLSSCSSAAHARA
jgi:Uma2 family endonuclease